METCIICGKKVEGPHNHRQVLTSDGKFELIHNECYPYWLAANR